VTAFKQKAAAFFNPFETVQDEVYDALLQAQALGVDISDIYMMLSSSCNVWGQYLCEGDQQLRYASCMSGERNCTCGENGKPRCPPNQDMKGKIAPMSDGGCQLLRPLTSGETIYQSWLDMPTEDGTGRLVAVACASDALDNSPFFKNRRTKIDDVGIEELAVVLGQDVYVSAGGLVDVQELKKCSVDGGSQALATILMSNRYSVVEPQTETTRPTASAPTSSGQNYQEVMSTPAAYQRDEKSGLLTGAAMQARTDGAIQSLNEAADIRKFNEEANKISGVQTYPPANSTLKMPLLPTLERTEDGKSLPAIKPWP
jgi:hypothetical protein